jgi:phage FluMu gp28-like protein
MNLWTPEEKLNYIYAFMKYDAKDIELDFWQDDFIRNRSRFISLLKSRQTGFSFVVSLKGMVKALDPARTKYTKQFVSYNEEDAQEKIRYAKDFYDSIPAQYREKKLIHSTATMLEFEDVGGKSTSRLISLPCRPPRGKNGDVCLDEFAIYLPRLSNEIYTAASFCTLRKGCIEVGSTPLGTVGKFYEICTNKDLYADFDRYFIPWWYAKVMCNDVKKAVVEAKNMTTEERVLTFGTERLIRLFNNSTLEDFQQECECTFIDSASSYISLELIYQNTPGKRECDIPPESVSDEEYYSDESNTGKEIKAYTDADELILHYTPDLGTLYMGYDVAKTGDKIAFYIIGVLKNGKKRSVMNLVMSNDPTFDKQRNVARKLLNELPIYRAAMDMTGIGQVIYADLHKEFGDKVEGVTFTPETKEPLAMGVKLGLERREFELENNRDFHAQIHSIKRTPTSGGNFRYDAERNEKGHADSFWAWALANHAATGSKEQQQTSFYKDYANKKKAFIENPNQSTAMTSGQIRTHGRSLSSVLRNVTKNNSN